MLGKLVLSWKLLPQLNEQAILTKTDYNFENNSKLRERKNVGKDPK